MPSDRISHSTDRHQGGCELLRPTVLGPLQPLLVENGAFWFCVGRCRNRSHSGSRLHRRFPFIGGSECPAPPESPLGHNRRCTRVVACEQRWKRGEHRLAAVDREGKDTDSHGIKTCGRYIPSLLAFSMLAAEGGVAPSNTSKLNSVLLQNYIINIK